MKRIEIYVIFIIVKYLKGMDFLKALYSEGLNTRDFTKKRYELYNNVFESGEDILWSKEHKAWFVFNYDLVSILLKDKRFNANRKKGFIDKLEAQDSEKNILSSFYSRWLMYMDEPDHSKLRKGIQVPINKINSTTPEIAHLIAKEIIIPYKSKSNLVVDAIEDLAIPFTNLVLSKIMGLGLSDYELVLREANNAIDFLWKPFPNKSDIQNTVNSINSSFNIIRNIIKNDDYSPNSLFDLVVKNIGNDEDRLALIINVAVDGHEPFLSAVKSFIFFYAHCLAYDEKLLEKISLEQLVEETLRLECPFPYCARSANEDIHINNKTIRKGDRVIFLISAANRDPKKFENAQGIGASKHHNLTFGVGSHFCPGSILTKKAVIEFAKIFISTLSNKKITIIEKKWNDSFGFRTLDKLILSIED